MSVLLYLVLVDAILFSAFSGTAYLVVRQVELIFMDETYIDVYLKRLQQRDAAVSGSVFSSKLSEKPSFQNDATEHSQCKPVRRRYSLLNFQIFFGSRWYEWGLFFLPINCKRLY